MHLSALFRVKVAFNKLPLLKATILRGILRKIYFEIFRVIDTAIFEKPLQPAQSESIYKA
jgi:hypothetical protein